MSGQPTRLPKPSDLAEGLGTLLGEGSVLRVNEPLARRTTLRVGGAADLLLEPGSEQDLTAAVRYCGEQTIPWMLLGRGSNLLVRDGGVRGLVISLTAGVLSAVRVEGQRVLCGGGARLKAVAVEAWRGGLSGLEFFEGIPGSVGGALRMNAGAMGSVTFDRLRRVRLMDRDGLVRERPVDELKAGYRNGECLRGYIALRAVFEGEPAPREVIRERMNALSQKRWNAQPPQPSAGCIFKNPDTISAGRLIDELSLKGTRVGGAVVSPVHANFIVNDNHATARDVLELIQLIRRRAREERGVELEPEVRIVGVD